MKLSINLDIPDDRVSGLLCSALEGGSNYWYLIVATNKRRDCLYFNDVPFVEGGFIVFETLERDEINGATRWTLDRAACERGLRVMADKYPHAFSCFLTENDDAETGDVFLQCALFGEVVFG